MEQHTAATQFSLTRGRPIAVTAPTGYALVDLLRDAGFTIDQRRLDRVFHDAKGPITGAVQVSTTPTEIQGLVKGVYHAVIRLHGGQVTDCDCDCPDWFQSGGKAARIPCKHILGTAVDAPWPLTPTNAPTRPVTKPAPIPIVPEPVATAPDTDTLTFNQRVRRAIEQAVARLADLVEPILQADRTPFLIGPTDVAKTSAIRLLAVRHSWAFEALDGMSSFADADLVGLKTDHGVYASVIARAFRRARAGETVLLFLDELTRLNQRAMDVLMRPLLPIPCEIAWAQRVPADDGQSVRMVEVPMWGLDWAPLGRCKVALACNPWGSALDPALVRRTVPLEVGFDPAVAALFQKPARDAIETSWKLVTEGQLPLPIGYTLLAEATDPADFSFAPTYFAQLRAIDRPAAEGFRKLLEGMGVRVGGRP
jgi:hypothetical protein